MSRDPTKAGACHCRPGRQCGKCQSEERERAIQRSEERRVERILEENEDS